MRSLILLLFLGHFGVHSWSSLKKEEFWADGIVPWSFVATRDDISTDSVHNDTKVGLSDKDFKTVNSAMEQIMENTCIKFKLGKPVKGKPWLFISRERDTVNLECQHDYISKKLKGQNIAGLGDIYSSIIIKTDGECQGKAWSRQVSSGPQILVISQLRLDDSQEMIKHMMHELLHALGVGHTQKRQDASKNIKILQANIDYTGWEEYRPCLLNEKIDLLCKSYNDYGIPYNCMSIMHYRDNYFLTDEATKKGRKSMEPIKEDCDLHSKNIKLTNTDVLLLNKMYCNTVSSPNYPEDYPNNVDELSFPLEVESGSRIMLTFISFYLEYDLPDECGRWDYVKVLDTDGTTELAKLCYSYFLPIIISSGNKMTVVFHSDASYPEKGFLATWTKVPGATSTSTSTSGVITSPKFPDAYPGDVNQVNTIFVPQGKKISLTITDLSIVRKDSTAPCGDDRLIIFDGIWYGWFNPTDVKRLKDLCGWIKPTEPIVSTGNTMTVLFESDAASCSCSWQGFKATWKDI